MVVGAFPVAKLGALLLKQISKPIANTIKEQAKNSPFFRTYVCMPPAQFYNWCEVKAKMWILNLGKPVNIPVLNEAMAIELGANLLGEGDLHNCGHLTIVKADDYCMFNSHLDELCIIVGGGDCYLTNKIIFVDVKFCRSARKEEAKENAKKEEMEKLHNAIRDLFFMTERQATEIREIRTYLYDLETKVVLKEGIKPKWPHLMPQPRQDEGVEKNREKPSSMGPPSSPPPSSPPASLPTPNSETKTNTDDKITKTIEPPQVQGECSIKATNLLLKAVTFVENEFWKDDSTKHTEKGIINLALEQLDMYRFRQNV